MANDKDGKVSPPLTLWVDRIEFEPGVDFAGVTRRSYILEIPEQYARDLVEYLQKRLEKTPVTSVRVKVVGRLVS